ncbi:exocyst complex component EXO70E2 [Cicer arietinum]|uniref:Exocyst subunit Exo70 family protein n=1 Tax=Cicer arietinum TaxID=3827 RepID=A0A1S3E5T0_CICAR|nr:exocyst complex component EXO70E2 [Cicer arietinum]
MEEHKPMTTICEQDQHMVAAAQNILKGLASSKSISNELRKTLLDLEIQLSTMSTINERKGNGIKLLERELQFVEDRVKSLETNHISMASSSEYLKLVGEIQTLTQTLQQNFCSVNEKWKHKELVQRANEVMQVVMSKLEEELVQILVQNKQYFELDYMLFHSNSVDMVYDESYVSIEDEQINETSRSSDDGTIDLVNPSVLEDLKSIAKAMFGSNYHKEFCHVFIASRKYALDEYFVILEIEKLSIENVLNMEWYSLNRRIKKWIQAMKIIVQVYLVSEKRLCKQVLGNFGSVYQICFSEISRCSIFHLLNFGEAIAMRTHTTENLFCLLDMYEVLDHVAMDIDILFIEEVDSFVREEFHKLLRNFGDSIKSTFLAFRYAIATNPSNKCFPQGGVHHLTRYVMNYIKALVEYGDSLNLLLIDEVSTDPTASNDNSENSNLSYCSLACNLRQITTTLESNLCNKSKLYTNEALQHIFMMNNIHYMVQKVKHSNLCNFFGDYWLRRRVGMFQNYARSYEKVTWSSILSMLSDESVSTCGTKRTLKKKCKDFSVAFCEVYKTQTGWSVVDTELREDLQISVSQKVIHAYRSFTGRNSSDIDEKWIKYSVDDLQCCILDLFQGSSKSLHHS